ncbi:hypothetical protein BKA70DRAFT_1245325 [Coprinopsis sp. MPI-PUGE-AT-0042]|nr:hypothetical protein BKA70DRAFT_1245325 [Coprinopsis sp. MPI-PUGE-AT-0042]
MTQVKIIYIDLDAGSQIELRLLSPGLQEPGSERDDAFTRPDFSPREGLVEFLTDKTWDWNSSTPDFANSILDQSSRPPARMWHKLHTMTLVSNECNFRGDGDEEVFCQSIRLKAANFPALRDVALKMPDCRFEGTITLPWSQLTSLTLEAFFGLLSSYFKALKQCTSLQHLRLALNTRNGEFFDRSATPTSDLLLPQLISLTLDLHIESDVLESFLDAATLPSLQQLKISGTVDQTACFQSISELIDRSGCSLAEVNYSTTVEENKRWRRYTEVGEEEGQSEEDE